jgi:hypothetical protein
LRLLLFAQEKYLHVTNCSIKTSAAPVGPHTRQLQACYQYVKVEHSCGRRYSQPQTDICTKAPVIYYEPCLYVPSRTRKCDLTTFRCTANNLAVQRSCVQIISLMCNNYTVDRQESLRTAAHVPTLRLRIEKPNKQALTRSGNNATANPDAGGRFSVQTRGKSLRSALEWLLGRVASPQWVGVKPNSKSR